LFLSLCLLFLSISAYEGDGLFGVGKECDLRCWLDRLVIVVPPQNFSVMGGTFYLDNLTFSHPTVDEILSDSWPDPTKPTTHGIKLGLNGFGAQIFSNWSFVLGTIKKKGTISTAIIHSQASLAFGFQKDQDGFIDEVNASECNTDVTLDKITFTGDLEKLLNVITDLFKDLITRLVDQEICEEVPKLVDENLTEVIRNANEVIREYSNITEPTPIPISPGNFDVRSVPILDAARFLIDKFIGVTGPLNLTYLVDKLSNGTGTLSLSQFAPGKKFEFTFNVASVNADITVGLTEAVFSHLDTWNDFELIHPESDAVLRSFTDLADLGVNVSFYVNVSMADSPIIHDDVWLYEEGNLAAYMDTNTLLIHTQVALDKTKYKGLNNKQYLEPTCMAWVMSPYESGFSGFRINMTIDSILLTAVGGNLEVDVRKLLNTFFAVITDNYKFAIPPLVSGVITGPGLDIANPMIQLLIASEKCPPDDFPKKKSINPVAIGSSTAGAVGAILILSIIPIRKCFKNSDKKQEKEVKPNNSVSAEDKTVVLKPSVGPEPKVTKEEEEEEVDDDENEEEAKQRLLIQDESGIVIEGKDGAKKSGGDFESSLLTTPKLSLATRILIPFLTFINAVMFVTSNTSIGAQVFVHLTFSDEREVILPSLFNFGLINSVKDMWKAGVYPLSLLVAVFSGIWPYTKLILMVFAWSLPPRYLSIERRGRLLRFLDALGKWSLLDSYIMIMMLVAFHFHVEFPVQSVGYVDQPTFVDIFVYPAIGFMLLMFSTLFSLLISHLMSHLNAHVISSGKEDEAPDALRRRPLFRYFNTHYCTNFWRGLVTVLLIAAAILFWFGIFSTAFSFDFVGLAGWALDLLGVSPHRKYSVVELGLKVPPSARHPNSFNVRSTQLIFFLVTIAVPAVHLLFLLALWLAPITRKVQQTLYDICTILYAWSGIDIFIVSIIASIAEISQFALFMVGDKCDFINPYLEKYFADVLGDYDNCFSVISRLQGGCWILFASVIIYTIAVQVIMNVSRRALDERAGKSPSSSASPSISDTLLIGRSQNETSVNK